MIDLDHNATTQPLPEVVESVGRVMREAYANPGSRHAAGRKARQVLEDGRETIAAILGASPSEVVFTSGGTEATNLALRGFAEGRTGTIALPPGEHAATEEPVRVLESRGWRRHVLPIDESGRLMDGGMKEAPWANVRLATSLLAHNETGVVQDVAALSSACRKYGIPFHLDAVQAVGKIDVDFHSLGVSTMSVAAHKFHGPRGVGALLVREGVPLKPQLFGGHQEQGRRPGTECVALVAGMAVALQRWQDERVARLATIGKMRNRLQNLLMERCEPAIINGSQVHRLPNTLNIAFPRCDGDALLVALDLEGVGCSLGSACASGSTEPAPILIAMGCGADVLQSSLRLSVGIDNTLEEMETAATKIATVVARLRGLSKRERDRHGGSD